MATNVAIFELFVIIISVWELFNRDSQGIIVSLNLEHSQFSTVFDLQLPGTAFICELYSHNTLCVTKVR